MIEANNAHFPWLYTDMNVMNLEFIIQEMSIQILM